MCLSDCVEDKFPKSTTFSSFNTAENPHPRTHPTPAWKTSTLSPTVAYASALLTAFSYPCFELTFSFEDWPPMSSWAWLQSQEPYSHHLCLRGLDSTWAEFSWLRRFSFSHLQWLNYYRRAFFFSGWSCCNPRIPSAARFQIFCIESDIFIDKPLWSATL